MLVPLIDDNSDITRPVFVAYSLIFINLAVFCLQQLYPSISNGYCLIPREVGLGEDLMLPEFVRGRQVVNSAGPWPIYLTFLSGGFLHTDFWHLFVNMFCLAIFGDNVEHRLGPWKFTALYFASCLLYTSPSPRDRG